MLIKLSKIIDDFDLNISGVIHIGAHHGEEYEDYKKQGISRMMFFEPVKANFQQLINLKGVTAYNLALGNMTGNKIMYIETANNGQSCSILEPGTHLVHYPGIIFDSKEIVYMDKLDNIQFDRKLYNMINIDVQGYELEVFKGSVNTLQSIDIIYSEINFEEVYKDCCLVGKLDNYLNNLGFNRVLTDDSPGAWGDALYLKYDNI